MKSQNSGAKWWEMGDKRDVPRGFVIGRDVNETWPYRERFPSPFSWEGKAARYRGGLRGDLESFGKKWKTLDARSRKMRSRGNSGEELSGFETRPNGGRMWWAEKVCGLVS